MNKKQATMALLNEFGCSDAASVLDRVRVVKLAAQHASKGAFDFDFAMDQMSLPNDANEVARLLAEEARAKENNYE